MKAKLTRDLAAKIVIASVAATGLFAYWKYLNQPPIRYNGTCISPVKQLGTALAIYGSDNDDHYPPYYTFESENSRDNFVKVTLPYSKNKDVYRCFQDSSPKPGLAYSAGMEGDPSKMSFVHPQSLKGQIPDYSIGKRVLGFQDIASPATTPILRDPIRGYGKDEKRDPTFTGFLSPHSSLFSILFADGHAKATRLDINTNL